MRELTRSLYCGLEEGLVALKEHARLNGYLLIQVQPGAISALLRLVAILQHPLPCIQIEVDRSLHLGE